MKFTCFDPCDPGLLRNIGERPVTVVVVKNVAAVLGNEQVGEPVVVVVSPHAAKAVCSARHPGLVSDVGEGTVPIVVVKSVASCYTAVVSIAAIDKVNVWPAVIVEIGNANSGAKLF